MASLVMTIDSDSESEVKAPTKQQKGKPAKGKADDEEILLGHSVILHDTDT